MGGKSPVIKYIHNIYLSSGGEGSHNMHLVLLHEEWHGSPGPVWAIEAAIHLSSPHPPATTWSEQPGYFLLG